MASDIRERVKVCPCGGNLYEPTWDFTKGRPYPTIWACTNCGAHTPRVQHHRRTNRGRAFAEWGNLNTDWKETDAALYALVKAGKCASGVLVVHTSTFNYHMRQLCEKENPSNWDIKYNTSKAKEALVQAKQFVAEKETANGLQ